jgi:hypothetical protein
MNENEKGTQGQPEDPKRTDKSEDTQERQDTAKKAWEDRQGIPRGTPEQGGKSADQVGGSGTVQPKPEIEKSDIERDRNRRTEDDEEEPLS